MLARKISPKTSAPRWHGRKVTLVGASVAVMVFLANHLASRAQEAATAPSETALQNGAFGLMAATANPDTKPEVRLRWTMTAGWLPAGGFNIYRSQSGTRAISAKLNTLPLGGTTNTRGARKVVLAPGYVLDVGAELAIANRQITDATRSRSPGGAMPMTPMGAPAAPVPSAKPVFEAMRAQIQTLRTRQGPGLSPEAIRERVDNESVVKTYLDRLQSSLPPAPTGANAQESGNAEAPGGLRGAAPAVTAERVSEARDDLKVGALLHAGVSTELGLAFNDPNVTKGATYLYSLRSIEADGKESAEALASVEITVGADPQPSAPTGFQALQLDENSVDLRWDRLPTEQEKHFILPQYRLLRTDAGNPIGVQANGLPVLIANVMTKTGAMEPVAFFHDGDPAKPVAPGKIVYKLIMSDIFGRESAPATLNFSMEDWRTPPEVLQTQAELVGNDVRVKWTPDPSVTGKGVRYRVFRLDTEVPTAQPELLTPTSIVGTPAESPNPGPASTNPTGDKMPTPQSWLSYTDTNAPKDHYYRYLLRAVFAQNNRDSGATPSNPVPIPQTSPLSPPTGLASLFLKGAKAPSGTPVVSPAGGTPGDALKPQSEVGGRVVLTWLPSQAKGSTTYRVYRAIASGFFRAPVAEPGAASPSTAISPSRAYRPTVPRQRRHNTTCSARLCPG